MTPAHGGRRRCTDDECRSRYKRRTFALAVGGMEEALAEGRWLRLLTFTLGATIRVPRCWTAWGPTHADGPSGKCSTRRRVCELLEIAPVGEVAYRYMSERFNALRVTLLRRWPSMYFRVVEEQKRGAPHYHLLLVTRSYLPHADLKALAVRMGLGSIVDIRAVRSTTTAAGYLVKYVMKDEGVRVPRGFRFYSSSRRWGARLRAAFKLRRAAASDGWTYAYVPDASVVKVAGALGLDLSPPGHEVAGQERREAADLDARRMRSP